MKKGKKSQARGKIRMKIGGQGGGIDGELFKWTDHFPEVEIEVRDHREM